MPSTIRSAFNQNVGLVQTRNGRVADHPGAFRKVNTSTLQAICAADVRSAFALARIQEEFGPTRKLFSICYLNIRRKLLSP